MPFSSTSSLESGSLGSSAPDSPPPPPSRPDYKKLESLLVALITLARRTYSCPSHSEKRTAVTEYLHLHPRLTDFFTKHQHHSFYTDGTYGFCLEISKLMRVIESGLPVGRRDIEALEVILRDGQWEMKEGESEILEKKVNTDVDLLIFGGMELDCERLPWYRWPLWCGQTEGV